MAASSCWDSTYSWEENLICISKHSAGLAYFSAYSDIRLLSKTNLSTEKFAYDEEKPLYYGIINALQMHGTGKMELVGIH